MTIFLNESEMEFLTDIKFSENNLDVEIEELRRFYDKNLIITLGPLDTAYSRNTVN